jgi:(S)-citramalyl-CoA lyase
LRIRSLIFTPASRLDRYAKARASGADWVIVDLEDGVAPTDKGTARAAVCDLLSDSDGAEVAGLGLRINPLTTTNGIRDMAALADCTTWPAMIVLPKVESAKEIRQIRSIAAEQGRAPVLLITLETALGVENAATILRECGEGIDKIAVAYGSADHSAETGSTMSAPALAWARGRIVNACGAVGVPALDGVCLDLKDDGALQAEADLVKAMGFAGKLAIHPAQIATINAAFTPTPQQIAQAHAMIAASEAAQGGAFSFNGKMVDAPVLAQAHRTISAVTEDT